MVTDTTFPIQVRLFLDSAGRRPNCLAELPLPAAPAGDGLQQAANTLDAIEAGLPDSQFAAATQTGLQRLAEAMKDLKRDELASYLQRAESFSGIGTARVRSRFRSMIRFCRELAQREPDVVPGLGDLRVVYLEHRRAELEKLEQALKNGNFDAIRDAGRNVKGSGATYGFAELTDIGKALEAAAKRQDAAAIESLLDRIEEYLSMALPSSED